MDIPSRSACLYSKDTRAAIPNLWTTTVFPDVFSVSGIHRSEQGEQNFKLRNSEI